MLHGQPAPVVTRWRYSAADPFAVTLAVRTGENRWVEWLLARDLVVESLVGPAGVGDIRMSPQVVHDYEIVEIEIVATDAHPVRGGHHRGGGAGSGGAVDGHRPGDPQDHSGLPRVMSSPPRVSPSLGTTPYSGSCRTSS